MKITNISNHSIGLLVNGEQRDLPVQGSLEVEELTDQMINLVDPYKKMLKLEVLYSE